MPIPGKQPSMAEHPTLEFLRRTLEEATREVLTIEFSDVGIEFSKLHRPSDPQSSVLPSRRAVPNSRSRASLGCPQWPTSTTSQTSKRNTLS